VLHPTNNPGSASTLNVVSSSLTTSATAIWVHQVCVAPKTTALAVADDAVVKNPEQSNALGVVHRLPST
jgi:hypothetical protein